MTLYVPAGIKKKQVAAKRPMRTRTTFSRLVMVSVGVSKLGFTDLIFVDPGLKVRPNGSYYRDVLLSQKLLPVMHEVSGEFFIFQQDNVICASFELLYFTGSVTTYLRCGGNYYTRSVGNFFLFTAVQEFFKSIKI